MIHKRFEELKHCGKLPSPSGVGLAILQITRKDDFSFEEIERCIQVDPALTGRVLRVANSGFTGSSRASNVHDAAVRLGQNGLRSVALGFTLLSSNRSGTCSRFDYERYWSWSLACASAARALAEDARLVDPAAAFTCGLVSRIGMFALASVHAETYAKILEEARGKPPEHLLALETRAFDIQHWEVAAAMFADWGMPEAFAEAVSSFALGPREEFSDDAAVVALARVLREAAQSATHLTNGIEADPRNLGPNWTDVLAPVGSVLMSNDRLRSVAQRAGPTWIELGKSFDIPTADVWSSGARPEAAAAASTPLAPLPDFAPSEADPIESSEVTVLAIDDDERMLKLLKHHLEGGGYRVITATDGKRGLALTLEAAPHIVVTDWMMPGLSGLELVQTLRRTEVGRNTYVVLLTAREDEQQVVEAFAAGADDYVTKPFNPRILLARVQAGQRMISLQRQVETDKQMRLKQVSEMGLLTRRLHAAALTDILTGLPNRRYAMSFLEREWSESIRLDRPLSVSIVDVDHFKQVNDELGHDAGDAVLKATADALRARTRRGDVVCRIGGEEFLVVNCMCDAPAALACADRLRRAVSDRDIEVDGRTMHVTVSVGTATRGPNTRTIDDLLKAADAAVYAAKRGGRNTVRAANGALPESA